MTRAQEDRASEVPEGDERELLDLVALLDEVTVRFDALGLGGRAGDSPSAQENRAIGGARAYLARRQAAAMSADLGEVRRRAADMVARAHAGREGRAAAGAGTRAGAASPPAGAAPEETPAVVARRTAAHGLVDVHDRDEVVERVLAGALTAVPGARWSSLCLADAGDGYVVHRTSDAAVDPLEERQRRLGVGPVADVLAGGDDAMIGDLDADARWPPLSDLARQCGVRGLVAVALPGRRWRGVLAVYADSPGALGAEAAAAAALFADHAAIALSGARRVAGLTRALESRDTIGQAKGILMNRDAVGPDEAFAKLVEASQHANLKVTEVARWVVAETAGAVGPE